MVRVRFAPSPTGYLRIDSARTFILDWINGARAALTGQTVGPSAFTVFAVLGRERVIERLRSL